MRASLCHLLIYPHPSPPHLSFPPRPPTRVYTLSLHAALPISRFDRFEMVPFATQRAPSCRATATAQALPHGSPPASAAATAAATALESIRVTSSDARSVASSLLVAAATTAVSLAWSTLACSPSNRRFTTTIAGRAPPVCPDRREPAIEPSIHNRTTPPART